MSKILGPWMPGNNADNWCRPDLSHYPIAEYVWSRLGNGWVNSRERDYLNLQKRFLTAIDAMKSLDIWLVNNGYTLLSKERWERLSLLK